ncbi:hypothetical protein XELAEV_18040884mg [Xenopus laevis]|uniref:Uncharacterized protein n=1 Tax=Xenopus laevis TaxID=8355 RepID=A0A974H9R6_XENLA|nr:hypothetical protein XELAEV_18040884mg [Xenopus laevis]
MNAYCNYHKHGKVHIISSYEWCNIKHGNTDAPVAANFCSNTHTIKDLRVTVLKGNFKSQQERKEWKFKLMRKFNTLECGLNRDRSFMSSYN